jgi:DNA modification methylase
MNVLNEHVTDRFSIFHADTVEVARELPTHSVDFSVFSPPFISLYTYSASPRDLGNSNDAEFWEMYEHLIREEARVMKPGRLVAIHCMPMPSSKSMHGYIGLRDFPGDIIRAYQRHGFVYHSEVCIWKDPVTAMQRTKALGLLHKQLRKDAAMSRQGIPDKVIVMRAPGDNPDPVAHGDEIPVSEWQHLASPVWAAIEREWIDGCYVVGPDIDPSDTLQHRSAREDADERHIAPLQLEVIRRCIRLWTRPNDIVWSPFAGIGSEGVIALEMGRRFVGAELKQSYYEQAVRNLIATATPGQQDLFASWNG